MSYVNPFESPQNLTIPALSQAQRKIPTYSLVMLIIDLVLRGLRLLVVLLGIVGIVALKDEPDMFFYGVLEVVTGGMMVVFGGLGDVLLLMKKRVGVYLCWLGIAATLANMGVGLAELPLQFERGAFADPAMPNADSIKMVAWTAAILTLLFRLTLTVMYGVAVYLADKSFRK